MCVGELHNKIGFEFDLEISRAQCRTREQAWKNHKDGDGQLGAHVAIDELDVLNFRGCALKNHRAKQKTENATIM